MKFDKPRVFVRAGSILEILDDHSLHGSKIDGDWTGHYYRLEHVTGPAAGWREVITDITKLDCAGVFHEVSKQPEPLERTAAQACYESWCRNTGIERRYEWLSNGAREAWHEAAQAAIELNGDIANATIAELRARVAELEKPRPCLDCLDCLTFENTLKAELRRLKESALARSRRDLTTADRIADLIGDKRPSEHEAADATK